MSRTLRLTASTIAVLFAFLATLVLAPPAEASSRPIDITGYKVADQAVSSAFCRKVTVSLTTKKQKDFSESWESHDVTKGRDIVDVLTSDNGRGIDSLTFCPFPGGFGKYTVGPADVFAWYNTTDSWGYPTENYRKYTDNTKNSFYVRAKSKASLSSSRKGKTVSLTAKAKSYNLDWDEYRAYNPKSATLQVKSGKHWKTVKKVKLSKGKATAKVSSSAKKQYRFTFPKTTTRTGATSNTVKR